MAEIARRTARARFRRATPALLLSLLTALGGAAQAATYVVTDPGDAGDGTCDASCTLRDAIDAATASGDSIVFDDALFGAGTAEIVLTQGALAMLDTTLVISNAGRGSTTLTITTTPGSGDRLFTLGANTPGQGVSLRGVTLRAGEGGTLGGGCLYAAGIALELSDVRFVDCRGALPTRKGFLPAAGGGLYFDASSSTACAAPGDCDLRLDGVDFIGNQTPGSGGALYVRGWHEGRRVEIRNSRFLDNEAGTNETGGAIDLHGEGVGGSLLLSDSTLDGNRFGSVPGFSPGGGGGLAITLMLSQVRKAAKGVAVPERLIERSTFSNNTASYGGGIRFDASMALGEQPLRIVNSTISGNRLPSSGAAGSGIHVGGGGAAQATLRLEHVTVSRNSAAEDETAGVVAVGNGVQLVLRNSVLDGNLGALFDGNADYEEVDYDLYVDSGPDVDIDYSLVRDIRAGSAFFPAEAALVNALAACDTRCTTGQEASLAPLAANGGPTQTHAPAADSPVVDAGDPGFAGTPATDQRGTGFPRLAGARIDLGAVETALAAPLLTATKTVSGSFVPGGAISYTITISNGGSGAQGDNAGDEFTDVLPAGLSLVSASATSGTAVADIGTRTVTWNGSIAAAGSVTITINATIDAGTGGSSPSNQGSLSVDSDGDGSNDSTVLTDDPGVAGDADPTVFTVGQPGQLAFDPASYTVSENVAGGSVSLTVTRTGGSDGAVSVQYASVAGSATAGSDFVATSGTLNWADGDSGSRSIVVAIIDDSEVEAPESFTVQLGSSSGGAVLGAATATVTISSDDAPPAGSLQFAQGALTIPETASPAKIAQGVCVSRSGGSAGAASVAYATVDGTATAPGDYVALNGTLQWADGDAADKCFTVTVLDDGLAEPAEQFTLQLSAASGATLGAPASVLVTIPASAAGSTPIEPAVIPAGDWRSRLLLVLMLAGLGGVVLRQRR